MGKREAFNVYVMDADGSNVRSLAPDIFLSSSRYFPSNPYTVTPPEIARVDSQRLAGISRLEFAFLVHRPSGEAWSNDCGKTTADPAWSPDGEWIAWAHSEPGSSHDDIYFGVTIYVARIDGSEARPVFQMGSTATHNPDALNLSWTPDGQSLRFVFAPSEFRYRLYQLSLGASNAQLIAEVPRWARIVWSPDGGRALVSNLTTSMTSPYDDGEELLYTIAADGSDKRVLVRFGPVGPVTANGE